MSFKSMRISYARQKKKKKKKKNAKWVGNTFLGIINFFLRSAVCILLVTHGMSWSNAFSMLRQGHAVYSTVHIHQPAWLNESYNFLLLFHFVYSVEMYNTAVIFAILYVIRLLLTFCDKNRQYFQCIFRQSYTSRNIRWYRCMLARTSAARSYKQWVKRNLQTESQIPGPSEWLGMRS